jgi:enamine deaminase RidA (YjgF/YER057c/UK114 family)
MSLNIIYHDPKGSNPAQGLYSNVGSTKDSHLHFVAGQLSVGAAGEVVGAGDFAAQFDQVFENLEAVLNGMGGNMRSVVKFTTYVTARSDIDVFMKKRATLFPSLYPDKKFPPNTLLIVEGLVKPEFLLEVEAIVAV